MRQFKINSDYVTDWCFPLLLPCSTVRIYTHAMDNWIYVCKRLQLILLQCGDEARSYGAVCWGARFVVLLFRGVSTSSVKPRKPTDPVVGRDPVPGTWSCNPLRVFRGFSFNFLVLGIWSVIIRWCASFATLVNSRVLVGLSDIDVLVIRVRRETFQSFTNCCCYSNELGKRWSWYVDVSLFVLVGKRSFHMSFAQSLARVCVSLELVRILDPRGGSHDTSLAFILSI